MKDLSGNARSVLDKLKDVEADLVRGQIDWQDWGFPRLIKALKSTLLRAAPIIEGSQVLNSAIA